jgi:hypothetical protein
MLEFSQNLETEISMMKEKKFKENKTPIRGSKTVEKLKDILENLHESVIPFRDLEYVEKQITTLLFALLQELKEVYNTVNSIRDSAAALFIQ